MLVLAGIVPNAHRFIDTMLLIFLTTLCSATVMPSERVTAEVSRAKLLFSASNDCFKLKFYEAFKGLFFIERMI